MIADTIARLTRNVPALKLVAGAAEFQQLVDGGRQPTATPACYVLTLGERPEPNQLGNLLQQKVSATLGLILVVRNVSDATGGAATLDVEKLRALVKDQLFGWSPAQGYQPLERGPGDFLAFSNGCLYWQDTFTTQYYDRSKQ